MSSSAKVVVQVLAGLALAVGVGLFIGWWQGRGSSLPPIAVTSTNAPMPEVVPVAINETPSTNSKSRVAARFEHTHAPTPVHVMTQEEANPEWEKHLDDVLLSDTDANTKADKILEMLPKAPADAQDVMAQHLVNMVQDDHYDGTAQLLTNSTTPAAVSTVLMNDLLNRSATLKLPMLLAVARDGDHPLNGQARDMLELLLQEDNGTNWDQWNTSISTWLQNNPQ